MTGWPDQPVIYEINTAVWLDSLSRASGRPVTLAGVGAADWDAAVPAGVDAVWLMGVWGRSPAGIALANWMTAAGQVLAHGRDPYFPPWPDVVQLDAFSTALRAATAEMLADIAGQCDGIRCDMAMLMTN